jgi:hypothetical protein
MSDSASTTLGEMPSREKRLGVEVHYTTEARKISPDEASSRHTLTFQKPSLGEGYKSADLSLTLRARDYRYFVDLG